MSGAGSLLSVGGAMTVGGAGVANLDIGSGATVSASGVVDVNARLVLAGGSFTGNGGLLPGTGDAGGQAVIDQGTVAAGAGTMVGGGDSALGMHGATSGQKVELTSAGLADLTTPAAMQGVIVGFAAGDTIDLGKSAATSLDYADGLLSVKAGTTGVADLHVAGSYTTANFALGSKGADSVISFQSTS